jgi:hypothetical protein
MDSTISGSSRRSLPCCRQKPQDLEDCSAAIPRRSTTSTDAPDLATWYAVEQPITPPPTTTTSYDMPAASPAVRGHRALLELEKAASLAAAAAG